MNNQFFSFFLLFFLAFTACDRGQVAEVKSANESTPDISQIFVKTAPVATSSETADIKGLGIIVSKTESKPSFKTGGIIDKNFFKEGDNVPKGKLLATLLMNEIDAQTQQAAEGLEKAVRDLTRAQNLYADSVATLEQVQNASTAVELAKRNLEIASFNQKYSEVRSPISGRITHQLLREGEIAGPGMAVCLIMGIGPEDWRIKLGLVDYDWTRIKIGHDAQIKLDAYPDRIFEAVVTDKSLIPSNGNGTFDIELKFKEQPADLAAGMISKVHLGTNEEKLQTTIPVDALVNTNGEWATVYSIEQGIAKAHKVRVGRLLGNNVVILSGLDNVEEIITIGSVYLEEGDQVIKAKQ
jgi:RND family efflux transporter MFP subunit